MIYRAGFDVGGTNARVHLFDESLNAIGGRRKRIRDATGPGEVAQTLATLLADACEEFDVNIEDVGSIGLGIAGQLSADGRTVLNAPNLGWRDVDFVESLEEALEDHVEKLPSIKVINDLNAQVWGEHIEGAVEGVEDVLAVYVGTGVGGAILAGGSLVRGADNNAGEIGHSKVVVGGRPCGCGENGCVEAYAGGIHLERRVAEVANNNDDEALDGLRTDEENHLGVADELALEHPEILEIWEEATDYLAIVIANACTLLNPRALLIGGGVAENCTLFRSMLLQKTIPLILRVARENIEVHQPSLGDFAGMLGAADLAKTP